MSLLLAVVFVVQSPVLFTPDRVGIRYAQSALSGSATDADPAAAAAESVPQRTGWRSSPGATAAQTACGCGSTMVPLSVGFVLAMGGLIHEDYGSAREILALTTALIPAASATGVALVGHGRSRTGRAFLGSYAGALVLGGLGLVVNSHDPVAGVAFGATLGSVVGSVVGYNIR